MRQTCLKSSSFLEPSLHTSTGSLCSRHYTIILHCWGIRGLCADPTLPSTPVEVSGIWYLHQAAELQLTGLKSSLQLLQFFRPFFFSAFSVTGTELPFCLPAISFSTSALWMWVFCIFPLVSTQRMLLILEHISLPPSSPCQQAIRSTLLSAWKEQVMADRGNAVSGADTLHVLTAQPIEILMFFLEGHSPLPSSESKC